jgi:hypothetical protein
MTHSNYTHHADVGECCADKIKKLFNFQARMTAKEYREQRKAGWEFTLRIIFGSRRAFTGCGAGFTGKIRNDVDESITEDESVYEMAMALHGRFNFMSGYCGHWTVVMIKTPWQRARKRRSVEQENNLATLPGGEKGVNSGRFWRFKRDGRLWEFLIEARTTENKSYSIEHDEFKQIERDAFRTPPGLLPGMQIDIRGLQLVVIRLNDFQEMQMEMDSLRSRLPVHEEEYVDEDDLERELDHDEI